MLKADPDHRVARRSSSRLRNRGRNRNPIHGLEALEDRRLMSADLAPAAAPLPATTGPASAPSSFVSTLLHRTDEVAITSANIARVAGPESELPADPRLDSEPLAVERERAEVFAIAAQPSRASNHGGDENTFSTRGGPTRSQTPSRRASAAIVIQKRRPLVFTPRAGRGAPLATPARRAHLTGDSQSDQQALVWFRQTHPGPPKETVEMKLETFGDDVEKFGKKVEKFGRKIGEAFQDIF